MARYGLVWLESAREYLATERERVIILWLV